MKLSTAIARGAALRPQAFGRYFVTRLLSPDLSSCALGAAWEAATGTPGVPRNTSPDAVIARVTGDPSLGSRLVSHPGTDQVEELASVIQYLNDQEQWPRERIAAWLSGLGL